MLKGENAAAGEVAAVLDGVVGGLEGARRGGGGFSGRVVVEVIEGKDGDDERLMRGALRSSTSSRMMTSLRLAKAGMIDGSVATS